MMKKLLSLILALILVSSMTAAMADPIKIDPKENRNIQINPAGLNADPDDMIADNISPTTGRYLDEIIVPEGYLGVAFDGYYQPIMMQISNSNNGLGGSEKAPYRMAPINGDYADIVYETLLAQAGQNRFTMIFSDVVPDFVGFTRSTRLGHIRLRQEWECAFVTSGWNDIDVKPLLVNTYRVKNPEGATDSDPGIAYPNSNVGESKPWKKLVYRLDNYASPNNELFNLTPLLTDVIPKDHKAANHTFKFTDEVPAGGDSGEIIYVTWGAGMDSDSMLQYDESKNAYIRYVPTNRSKTNYLPYEASRLVNMRTKKNDHTLYFDARETDREDLIFTFNNVIVQYVIVNYVDGSADRPDPVLNGTGNADYFFCGKHYKGVWDHPDDNSRTVFYGEDGNEISLQRGRTLIIQMDYKNAERGVAYE